jgi:hypothetical protein
MTKNTPERITFRPGVLAGPLSLWCDEHNVSPSDAIRIAIATMLGVDSPEVPMGRPPKQTGDATGEQ